MDRGREFKRFVLCLIAVVFASGVGLTAYYFYPTKKLPENTSIDRLVLIKHSRSLHLLSEGKKIESYKVSLGRRPQGKKNCQGDFKTPEGKYVLDWKNPQSCCHLSIHISYPDEADRKRAGKMGCSPGGDIMIHGIPPKYAKIGRFHRFLDWTHGCIAVTNREMDQIYRIVKKGTPIEIKP